HQNQKCMNLDELKTVWQEYDRKLQSAQSVNERIINSMIRERSHSRLARLRRENSFLAALTLLWAFLFCAVLIGNPFDFRYVIQYVPTALLLFWAVASFSRLMIGYRILKADFEQPDLSRTLSKLIALYEKHNKSAGWVVLIMMLAGLLFSLSFLPAKIESAGLWPALGDTFAAMAIAALLYFIAYKLGVFKDRYGNKFKQDLEELEELKSMSAELASE
ncbi:MAG TPA: hypothetical protein VFV68_12680, partial [Agriterribacter sp.]|nr:hypothetical protein [Agriterribacter sp.]